MNKDKIVKDTSIPAGAYVDREDDLVPDLNDKAMLARTVKDESVKEKPKRKAAVKETGVNDEQK